ncbi:MAG: tRNA preQ1(34) S-adenosylmethionine ribosyltransferase-isomerase QueA [Rhodospirillales bacterium]|nr:tRNA preQ1(34) S-adenosylmethionine ribosyltransferase-isomerase QueA [Rhodospirillales bacterium]
MQLSDFDFDLPPDRIAQRPVSPRDAARLLEVGPALVDLTMRDLPGRLRAGDLLVYNDTKVIKARLAGRRGTAGIQATLHRMIDAATWYAFARPAKKLKVGDRIVFAPDFAATVREKGDGGEVMLHFDCAGTQLMAALDKYGQMPLPPYVKRAGGGDPRDMQDYQTVWAAREGAVAASTAGLHFTPALLGALDAAGVRRVALTLHVGAGTFLPVKSENVAEHRMHAEWGEIGPGAAAAVNRAKAEGRRILAIGTTALRVLETVADPGGRVKPWSGETQLFVLPGFAFRAVDLLLTNFHLPRSTLFMLVAAFAGLERMRAAYAHAIRERYRFFSYGDACLIHRAAPGGPA